MVDTIKKKRNNGDAPVDNFVVFKERLVNASEGLRERKSLLSARLHVLRVLRRNNNASLMKWEEKLSTVSAIHDAYSGDDQGERILSDLMGTAARMRTLFAKRVDIFGAQIDSVQSKVTAIDTAIDDIDTSISKLEFSKMLHDDREKLMALEASISGGSNMPLSLTSDTHNLPPELQTAREAVAMAEALLELKGN